MKSLLILVGAVLSFALQAELVPRWITIGRDVLEDKHITDIFLGIRTDKNNTESIIALVDETRIPELSEEMHHSFNRCGGFVSHDSIEEAKAYQKNLEKNLWEPMLVPYTISRQDLVSKLVEQVEENKIARTITTLSDFKNRYYTSKTGVESAKWIYATWKTMLASRSDAQVETYTHTFGDQPSVIATIRGNKYPDEIVIIGGHLDSISGYMGGENSRAPGADDNASGIAVITETIRLIVENGHAPERTIKFMGYAAEEVGLRGSKAIAEDFKKRKLNVIGALQLDMTNYHGSSLDIVFMKDYTSEAQNRFVSTLIDEYVKVPWGYDSCGYACSDHASWTAAGYPSSMPFETKKNDMNPNIHTSRDLLSVSGNADHAVKFAKLAIAYAIELSK